MDDDAVSMARVASHGGYSLTILNEDGLSTEYSKCVTEHYITQGFLYVWYIPKNILHYRPTERYQDIWNVDSIRSVSATVPAKQQRMN